MIVEKRDSYLLLYGLVGFVSFNNMAADSKYEVEFLQVIQRWREDALLDSVTAQYYRLILEQRELFLERLVTDFPCSEKIFYI